MLLPNPVRHSIDGLLRDLDRFAPGAVTGLYVVGSVALGAYWERRSDIDFVAVVAADGPQIVHPLRWAHRRSALRTAWTALHSRRSPLAGTCNGVYVSERHLRLPVTQIVPLAIQTGARFRPGARGSDASPVAWKTWLDQGIPVRGAHPAQLGLASEPEHLCAWNLQNLHDYWLPWATSESIVQRAQFRMRPRWMTAWGMLGPPRLHHTISTGKVISKEAAGEYALDTFGAEHHPLILDALAYRRSQPSTLDLRPSDRHERTRSFILDVIASAAEPAAG